MERGLRTLVSLSLLLCVCLWGVSPVWRLPLDGTAEVLDASGKVVGAGVTHGAAKYVPGVQGQGLEVRRQAYDQVTALNITKLPQVNATDGTVSFWFKPNWRENDEGGRTIFAGRDADWKGFRFYLNKRKAGGIELSVVSPKQVQLLCRNILKQGEWQHIAFTWEQAASQVRLFVNGREVATRTLPGALARYHEARPVCLFLGAEQYDRFKTEVGEGVYDDILYYDQALSPEDIFLLASGGERQRLVPADLSAVTADHDTGHVALAFVSGSASYGGPRKLFRLAGAGGIPITVTAMGASRRLSLVAETPDGARSVETSYSLQLDQPHRLEFRPDGTRLAWWLDDALQGTLDLPTPFGALASLELADDIALRPPAAVPSAEDRKALADTATSAMEAAMWTLDDAERRQSGVRSGVCLNNYWRVKLDNDYRYAPPAGPWGYQRVPGSFRSPLYAMHVEQDGKLKSEGFTWQGQELVKYRVGWYQRVFTVPSGLRSPDGRLFLHFTNLNADNGRVYLNGRLIDEFRQDDPCFTMVPNSRRLDVTDLLSGDGPHVVTVYLDRRLVGLWRGVPSIGDHQEIALDDVWLESAPSPVSVRTVTALSSYRRREVTLRVRLENRSGERGEASVRAVFRREGQERVFAAPVRLTGEREQVVVFTSPWKDAALWDCETPNLYELHAEVRYGERVLDTSPVRLFGFREMWIDGGKLMLNGRPTRLRMWSCPGQDRLRQYFGLRDTMGQFVRHIKTMNYDSVRTNPFGKSSQVGYRFYFEECDRQGVYNVTGMPPYAGGDVEAYRRQVERYLDAYGGHPSIVMWYTDFNTCSYAWNQDPAKLTDLDYDPPAKRHARALAAQAESVMNGLDPTREAIRHAGGNAGKAFGSMNYQSFGTPLQEQEDWPRQWAANPRQPLFSIECAFPYPNQFWHFDHPELGSLCAEHAARYFGDEVYRDENRPVPNAAVWLHSPYARWDENYRRLSALHYRNVVRAWRAYGVTCIGDFPGGRDMCQVFRTYDQHNVVYGRDDRVKTAGLKPDVLTGWSETQRHLLSDYTQPDGNFEDVRYAFAPLLVYLGGPAADFTSKEHAFFADEAFEKSIIVVNDHTRSQRLDCRWELVSGGQVVDRGQVRRTIEAGAIGKWPLKLRAPEVFRRTEGELRLTVLRDGRLLCEDRFALQFFPVHQPPSFFQPSVSVYDPAGRTTAMLRQAGLPFREARTLADVRASRLLIVGAGALRDSNPELLQEVERSGLLERGLKLLIFEQSACNLANLVFESPSYRQAFVRRADSPFVRGLTDADFSDWRGKAMSVPEFVVSAENTPHYPRSKWKCGNGGIVAGNVIRKPSHGNFRTIVDCGFNLMFAGLLELTRGHGQVVFCQLDVTGRYGVDPAATQLVDNLLTAMTEWNAPVGPQRVGYLGDAEGQRLLDRMGMVYKVLDSRNPYAVSHQQVVVIGPNHGIAAEQLDAFRRQLAQRTAIALPGADLSLLQGSMSVGRKLLFRARMPAAGDVVFAGIPEADLYFREAMELPVVTGQPDWTVATSPALFAKLDIGTNAHLVLAVAPDDVKGLWNSEKVARIWSTLLTNMNIGLGRDLQLFTASKARHNTLQMRLGSISLEQAEIRFDPENLAQPDVQDGYQPYQLGLSWESRGFTQNNPHYVYPSNTPASLKKMYDGYAWVRCRTVIPETWRNSRVRLVGGPIDDADWTYLNGHKIGETLLDKHPDGYKLVRDYEVPSEAIRFGAENTLLIRIYDRWGDGGVTGPLHLVAEDRNATDAWSPYIDQLDFYDVDAFHNW